MALPTAIEITNIYLYGQNNPPGNIADSNVVNTNPRPKVIVDTQEYMTSGSGRFVSAADFNFIEIFFNFPNLAPLLPGSYNKHQLFSAFGLSEKDNSVTFNNINYGVNDSDYAERTYIWGTVAFAVSDDAVFLVHEDGARSVENFSIVPLQIIQPDRPEKRENFDFEGGPISDIGNNWLGLYDIVDPSRIGKTVTFEFSGEITKKTINLEQFNQLENQVSSPSIPATSKIWELTDKLFSAGSTRFLQDGKPIIYGDSSSNVIEDDIANYDAINFHMSNHRQLGQYVKNGIVYVAGDGNDTITATASNDILLGGNGDDLLYGNAGNDTLEGGTGDDVLDGGTGFNILDGGTGTGDIFVFDGDFGNARIKDADGGQIRIAGSALSVRRTDGAANTDGIFLFLDELGNPLAGKENWSVSVSGSTLTLFVSNGLNEQKTIVVDGFSWSNTAKQFGITFGAATTLADVEQTAEFNVVDGQDWLQQKYNTPDIDPFENRSLNYNATDYLYHYGTETDGNGAITEPKDADAVISYVFDGNNEADVLNGSSWLAIQQSLFNAENASTYTQLRRIGGTSIADSTSWVGDILNGYDGDDIITGDGKKVGDNGYDTVGDRDALVGGKGSDYIYGGAGDDYIFAWQAFTAGTFGTEYGLDFDAEEYTSVRDAMYNDAVSIEEVDEKNFIDGGSGNDVIAGASYSDTIDGGSGGDYIMAGAGRDVVLGGSGNDLIYADSFYVQSTTGAIVRDFIAPDVMPGEVAGEGFYSRSYFYRNGEDMDALFNPDEDYNDVIDGGENNDTIFGEIGNDSIAGGMGNDILFGDRPYSAGYFEGVATGFQKLSRRYHGDDVIDGGVGADKIIGGGGSDYLVGGEGGDTIYGDVGVAIFDKKASAAIAGDNADAIKASDDGWWGADFILGSAGTDVLVGEGNNDTLDGGDGNDQLYGDWTPEQTEAFNNTAARTGNDTLYGGNGDDQLMGNSGDDMLEGGSGNDTLFGDSYKSGGKYSGTGDDVLAGGEGNDALYGGAGNDTLDGGSGDDYLIGGHGNDKYIIAADGGIDVVDDAIGSSTLYLSSRPVKTLLQNNNAIIYLSEDGSNRIQMSLNSFSAVEKIYVNGQVMDLEITVPDVGTGSGTGILHGTGGNDIFLLGDEYAGNHVLGDVAGKNTLQLGDGWLDNGYLNVSATGIYTLKNYANPLNPFTAWETSWDAITDIRLASGEVINLHIDGDEGNNIIQGINGNDLLDGGAGNDNLTGGSGADIFLFGAGSDHDAIKDDAIAVVSDQVRLDFTTGVSDLTIEILTATNELKIGRHDESGAITDSIKVNKALGHLVDINNNDISIGTSSLLQVVNEQLENRTITLARNTAEDRYVIFSAFDLLGGNLSNAEKSRWQITSATPQTGNFDSDFSFIENFWGSDINYIAFLPSENAGNASFQFTLQRDDGLTFISSMNVNTQTGALTGSSGNDIMDGGQNDVALTINALAGNDLVRDGYGNDVVHGDDGNDVLTHNWQGNGDDVYYGDAGNDTLDAGWGTDTMVGGSGNDLYIESNLWSGDHTTIDNSTAAIDDLDTLQIVSEGYGMWDYRSLWFTQDGNDLLVNQLDALEPGQIRIKRWFDVTNTEAKLDVIRVQQDDGNVYEAQIDTHFDALVQAMAGFAPPASVGDISSTLADEYHAAWTLTTPMAA